MKYTTILWIAALLCVFQNIEARSHRFVQADEETPKVEIEEVAAVENTEKTEVAGTGTKHECAENETEDEKEQDANILVINTDELKQILLWAQEAQGRAQRRYNFRVVRGPRRGVRRRGGRPGNRRRVQG